MQLHIPWTNLFFPFFSLSPAGGFLHIFIASTRPTLVGASPLQQPFYSHPHFPFTPIAILPFLCKPRRHFVAAACPFPSIHFHSHFCCVWSVSSGEKCFLLGFPPSISPSILSIKHASIDWLFLQNNWRWREKHNPQSAFCLFCVFWKMPLKLSSFVLFQNYFFNNFFSNSSLQGQIAAPPADIRKNSFQKSHWQKQSPQHSSNTPPIGLQRIQQRMTDSVGGGQQNVATFRLSNGSQQGRSQAIVATVS